MLNLQPTDFSFSRAPRLVVLELWVSSPLVLM